MNKINNIDKKLKYLNLKLDSYVFNVFRVMTCAIVFFLLFISLEYGYIVAPIVVVIYYYLFEYVLLDLNISKKNKMLLVDSLDYFPYFLLVLKSNKNIVEAIKLTNKTIENSISKMFDKVLDDVKIGKTLEESLSNILEIIPSDIIANIVISIMESDKDGNDITDSVNKQLDIIRINKTKIVSSYYKSVPYRIGICSFGAVAVMVIVLIILKIYL